VGTKEFACAVIERLGQKPHRLKPVSYAKYPALPAGSTVSTPKPVQMELKGIDLIIDWPSRNTNDLAALMTQQAGNGLSLDMIDNRGVKVFPPGLAAAETFCTDSFRCRFLSDRTVDRGKMIDLVKRIADAGVDIVMTASLRTFDGREGYSLAQGQ